MKRRYRINHHDLIDLLHKQADQVREKQSWKGAHELHELLNLVREAKPRQRFVKLHGVKFPIGGGLLASYAICPNTGRTLLGVI